MKKIFLFLLLVITTQAFAIDYPKGPDNSLTPGSFCANPDSYRYPENIAYCRRDVSQDRKNGIFLIYKNDLGFNMGETRKHFKIDHYIPLCAGGSNKQDNLWPQHSSIYSITDPIESVGCQKLGNGLITQKELVDLIRLAKNNLDEAADVLKRLQSL